MTQANSNVIPPGLGLHFERTCLFALFILALCYIYIYILHVSLTFAIMLCRLCTTSLTSGTMCLQVELPDLIRPSDHLTLSAKK